jgi:hypothetical protein
MDGLKKALRLRHASLKFAVEIHPETVTDPLTALVYYGEDLLEAKQTGFDFFFTRPIGSPTSHGSVGIHDQPPPPTFLDRLAQRLGGPERIWLAATAPTDDMRQPGEWLATAAERKQLDKAIGLIYMGN